MPVNTDNRTNELLRYQPWLQFLARVEIDSRFAGKFSASDVVQQTLMAAWQDWEQVRGDNEMQRRAWLRQVLAHQLAHLTRLFVGTQKRDLAREQPLNASLDQTSRRLDRLAVAEGVSPSGLLEAREQYLHLARVLDELPGDYRNVLILRHFEDLPHEQVARRMNRSVGAARMLWMRALAELRERLTS